MSADFYLGTTLGMVLALILILAVVFRAGRTKANPSPAEDLLRERNEIGEGQMVALQNIERPVQQMAVWYAHYLNKEKVSRRDALAAMFLQGILANGEAEANGINDDCLGAYRYADEMIAISAMREKKEEEA